MFEFSPYIVKCDMDNKRGQGCYCMNKGNLEKTRRAFLSKFRFLRLPLMVSENVNFLVISSLYYI